MASIARKFKIGSRRKSESQSSLSITSTEISVVSTSFEPINLNLPVIPPEIWLHILKFVSFGTLWYARGTARLWNSQAILRAWTTILDTEIGVQTYIENEHKPLSFLQANPEILKLVIPEELKLTREISDAQTILPSYVKWFVKERFILDGTDLRFSYHPSIITVKLAEDLEMVYRPHKPTCVRGALEDLLRKEQWHVSAPSGEKKLLKRWTKNTVPIGRVPEWTLLYIGIYTLVPTEAGRLIWVVDKVTLQEVTLPIWQVIGIWEDARKQEKLHTTQTI